MQLVAAASAALALAVASVSAHGPPGSNTHGFVKRATSTTPTEASEAQITNSAQECTAYYVPEVAALRYNYPTIWQTAQILSNDTEAQDLYNKISPTIPAGIEPRGTREGDFSNVTYSADDPDCWWTYGANGKKCDVPKHPGIPTDITICNEPKTWGYTFDDGPNCTHNAFYDFLQKNNQKATMCYIGSNVLDWPMQAQRGLVDGHHLISHTWSHPYMTALTSQEVFAELYYSAKAIKEVVGVTVDAWRPPYGDVDDRVRAIATGLGLKTVMWSADTDDWEIEPLGTKPASTIEANYATIINNVSDTIGNIVLTHEINEYTMAMAMEQYPNITAKFDHVVPLTACMNWTSPYAEDITYPDFAAYVKGDIEPSGIPTSVAIASATWSPVDGGGSSAVALGGYETGTTDSTSSDDSSSSSDSKSTKSAAMGNWQPAVGVVAAVVAGAAFVMAA